MARSGTREELARPADLRIRILDHLGPLGDPADGAGNREEHREHRGREPHRPQYDPGIKIDIRVELPRDEILVVECDLLELHRKVEQRLILDAELVEDLMTAIAQDMRTGIIIVVNS